MNLVDDTPLEEAVLFAEVAARFPKLFTFDWEEAWNVASEPVEPWDWEWRTPLRGLVAQLTNRSDVTAWTQEAGSELARLLREPATLHQSLLGFREEETGLLPAVAATDVQASVTVSAEGDEGSSRL